MAADLFQAQDQIFKQINNSEEVMDDIVHLNSILKDINWINFFKNLLKMSEEEVKQKSPPVLITRGLREVLLLLNPWITKGIKISSKNLKKLYQTKMKSNSVHDNNTYVNYKKIYKKVIQHAKNCIVTEHTEIPQTNRKHLNLPLYSLFAKKYFNNGSKMAVEELVDNVRLELLKLIKSSVWLDTTTKKNAIEKAMSMVSYVGYPNKLEEPGVLDIYYEKLNIDDGSYLKSIMLINNFNSIKKFDKLLQPTEKTKWIRHTDTTLVNAYYMPVQNCIDITVAILNEPFFNKDRPSFMNYAQVGMVIGHEMMHGFDNSGMRFDKNGNYLNWWSDDAKKIFQRKAQCIARQYSNYTFPGLHIKINGEYTLGENIADNIGLQLSHLAYKTWVKNNDSGGKLPGLNYTQGQLFWVSFAQGWCEKLSEGYHGNLLDVHSPNRYRVIGTLSNNKEFAKDFKCPENANMNPSTKCKGKIHLHLKWLCSILFLTSFFLGAFLTGVIATYTKQNTCLTRGCINAASKTMKYLNLSVNPCDDFYEFACGNYQKETAIREDEIEASVFSGIQATVQNQLRTVLQDPGLQIASKPYQLLRKLYKLCMDTVQIEREGLNFAKELLKSLGGWPLLDGGSWNKRPFDWIHLEHKLRTYGLDYNHIINFGIEPDRKNSSRRVIFVDDYWISEILVSNYDAYFNFIVGIAQSFGANKSKIESDVYEIVEFERKLVTMYVPLEMRKNHTNLYNPITIAMLYRKIPTIDWLRYINGVINTSTIKITEDEVIIISDLKYFTTLSDLLRCTPKRVQANYIITKTVLSIASFLPEELLSKQEQYYQTISGGTYRKPRWKMCVETVSESLRLPLSALYVKKYFENNSKMKAKQIIHDVQEQFTKMLSDVDWLDKDTRKHALEKVSLITSTVGYPHQLINDTFIERYHKKLEISTSFLKAVLNISLFNENCIYEKLRSSIDKLDWVEHSQFITEVNAFYCVEENSIVLPAGILQGFFFNKDRPNYMNYGVLGFIVGHEMTHGFDNRGRLFDKEGQIRNWWSEKTKAAFLEKAQCIIEQYGNYTLPEFNLTINGIHTQGENIADNGGLKQSYLAYNKWAKRNQPELKLPGLNYTPNQMFWISAAQLWCSKFTNETIKSALKYDPHSPPEYRIIGPFSNSENFTKDFNCPLGSRMNPIKKCSVW
ncbi:hypothetical protein RI129_004408 [Pyrocoelia pectoralis]|uniref:Uncharacterized protein n=1 Tax=Pyrocoelia pectoralis TaxID=417401 RepID=A0AAN7VKY5_9COLE